MSLLPEVSLNLRDENVSAKPRPGNQQLRNKCAITYLHYPFNY